MCIIFLVLLLIFLLTTRAALCRRVATIFGNQGNNRIEEAGFRVVNIVVP